MNNPSPTYEYNQFLKPEIPDEYPDIEIKMCDKSKHIWSRFGGFHEVVIYKEPRKMFPAPRFTVHGLKPYTIYAVKIVFDVLHPNFFTYNNKSEKWTPTTNPNNCFQSKSVTICATGECIQNNGIDFGSLHITSSQKNANDKVQQGQMIVCLTSRTMYQIRITLRELQNDKMIHLKEVKFNEMVFITCSQYCGKANRDLKKQLNRYATKRSRYNKSEQPPAKRLALESGLSNFVLDGENIQNKFQEIENQPTRNYKSIVTSLSPDFESYPSSSTKPYSPNYDYYHLNSPDLFQTFDTSTLYPVCPIYPTTPYSQYEHFQHPFSTNFYYDSYFA